MVAVLSIFICGRRLLLMIFDIPASKSMTKSGVSYMLIDGFSHKLFADSLMHENLSRLMSEFSQIEHRLMWIKFKYVVSFLPTHRKFFSKLLWEKKFYLLKEQIFRERRWSREEFLQYKHHRALLWVTDSLFIYAKFQFPSVFIAEL